MNKGYEKAVIVAESHYAKGELEAARSEYINALRFKPNQQDAITKINEINLKLGIVPEAQKVDAVLAKLEENKKKPLKKSNWQQRLESAVKQRGINPPKK